MRHAAERAELARDAARMKRCGLTERQIAEKLECSPAQAHILIHEGIDSYLNEAKQESGEWLNAIIAEHIKIAQEAWIQWERSKQNRERTTSKTTAEGGIEVTEMIEGRDGDPRQLAIVQSSMDSIAKLRKLFVEQEQERTLPPPPGQGGSQLENDLRSMLGTILPPQLVNGNAAAESSGNGSGNGSTD